ncbi:hypothetical protein HN51_034272 [Arachis hypogaea]|uniref:DC1 domain-containing protein n=1 Tax=Arachis hypogaea TaxID=3818 RepID=A0A445A8U8_ARAHY|nr:uncharacterized protein LOC107628937 [Arachis ipaensis]XP_025642252.1 uncharacterized protein LOC112736834 [Arachis hypogaea]QHN99107.1 uncharacterized protein DS421_13g395020 [Arachis hypogaea]RYR22874.1 hypothetical protein Ahy_B03g068164 [Arachis hypogaea]
MKYNEIYHFHHPYHKLKFENSEIPFKCDGCKEVGIGSRYKCSTNTLCDYDLHMQCALPSPTFFHPFYRKCNFQFMSHPPGETARYCNACEKDVNGFVYHCRSCGYDLHPCCAKLPMVVEEGEVKLYLYRKVRSWCHHCGRKGGSWSYRSKCKSYTVHVACVREMLVENWHHVYTNSISISMQSSVHRSKGRMKNRCCDIAAFALQIVISAILGDPTPIISAIVASLISTS